MVEPTPFMNFSNYCGRVPMTNEVKVEISPWLSHALGKKSKITLREKIRNGDSLRSVLERLAVRHEGFGATIYDIQRGTVYDPVVIFVNNRPISRDLKVTIQGGDTIAVTPFYSGG